MTNQICQNCHQTMPTTGSECN